MSTLSAIRPVDLRLDELKLYRRVAWRIMPLAILCFFFSYFDRINISFAKTQMQAELGLSDAAYGFAASVFFVGYVLFEVPSSIGLRKFGAPSWICRIMVSWGLATAALMFVYDQYSLYFLRFLIGVMEAGFGPAILFYLACWFPRKKIAGINGIFFLAVPLSGAIGAPVSGIILEKMNGVLGLAGWHWLFLLSGLPCAALGLVTLWKLDRDIDSAKWLTVDEKQLLMQRIEEDSKVANARHASLWGALLTKEVFIFASIYFVIKTAAYGLNFWMPNLIAKSGSHDALTIGVLVALPYAVAFVGMIAVTRYSDHTGDRRTPTWCSLLLAAAGYLIATYFSDSPYLMMGALMLATAGSFIAVPVFWAMPQSTFTGLGMASAIAAINSAGQLSGMVAPLWVGYVNDLSGNAYLGMMSLAPVMLIGVVVILVCVPKRKG